MKIYTISSGAVSEGAIVRSLSLKNAGIEIPAILIGEVGRGRERGALPVQLTESQQKEWQEKGEVVINFADVGTANSGKPKLFSKDSASMNESVMDESICVFYTKIGFRGGNSHTGDRNGETDGKKTFSPFPGKIITRGTIAQGDAGRMGSGEQLVAVMPKGVFRTSYNGRLYGSPSAHYYKWDGQKMIGGLTWDERSASDIF